MFTGVSLVYYCVMIYLTLDRLWDVLLNIKYHLYWQELRVKCLLTLTWVVGVGLSITISLFHRYTEYNWEEAFFKYFYPTLEFLFVVVAVITYSIIFNRYRQTRCAPTHPHRSPTPTPSVFQVFRNSRFYISLLIVSTFFVFMLIPDLIYLFVGVIPNNVTELLSVSCWISYATSNLIDAYIYIYMQVMN